MLDQNGASEQILRHSHNDKWWCQEHTVTSEHEKKEKRLLRRNILIRDVHPVR